MTANAIDNRDGGRQVAEALRALGVKGVLVQMAERGQLIELRCEMPQCYCEKGRGWFAPKSNPMTDWSPNPDHYPILKMAGGTLQPDNVRLAHVLCNNTDYGWRTKIKKMLAGNKSLQEIADSLNLQKGRRPHGESTWTPQNVRKTFVS